MTMIGDLVVRLRVDSGGFSRGLQSAKSPLREFSTTVGSLRGIGTALTGGLAGIAATAGVGKLKASLEEAAQKAQELEETANKLGTGTEGLQRIQAAAQVTGTDLDTLERGALKLNQQMLAASRGNVEASSTLGQLGLSAQELANTDLEGRLGLVADALSAVQDPAERVRLSMELMGKSGPELLDFFSKGSSGLRELGDEAERTGAVIDEMTTERLAQMGEQMNAAKASMSASASRMAADMGPGIVEGTSWLADFMKTAADDLHNNLAMLGEMASGASMEEAAQRMARAEMMAERVRLMEEARAAAAPPPGPPEPPIKPGLVEASTQAMERFQQSIAQAKATLMGFEHADTGALLLELGNDRRLDPQREQLEKLYEQSRALEKQVEQQKQLQQAEADTWAQREAQWAEQERMARKLEEDMQTPMEQLDAYIGKLDELRNNGLISDETYAAAAKQKAQDLVPQEVRSVAEQAKEDIKTPFDKLEEQAALLDQAVAEGLLTFDEAAAAQDKLFEELQPKQKERNFDLAPAGAIAADLGGVGEVLKGVLAFKDDSTAKETLAAIREEVRLMQTLVSQEPTRIKVLNGGS